MFYIIVVLAAIFAVPANALDGTPSPANVAPAVAPRGHIPNSQYWHNPNLLEQARQLRRVGDELLAQANPGGNAASAQSIKDQLVGTWRQV